MKAVKFLVILAILASGLAFGQSVDLRAAEMTQRLTGEVDAGTVIYLAGASYQEYVGIGLLTTLKEGFSAQIEFVDPAGVNRSWNDAIQWVGVCKDGAMLFYEIPRDDKLVPTPKVFFWQVSWLQLRDSGLFVSVDDIDGQAAGADMVVTKKVDTVPAHYLALIEEALTSTPQDLISLVAITPTPADYNPAAVPPGVVQITCVVDP